MPSTLQNSLKKFELDFFNNLNYIFVDFGNIDCIYNLFDFKVFYKNLENRKKIVLEHLENSQIYLFFSREFIYLLIHK